jgi:hypothetical protein
MLPLVAFLDKEERKQAHGHKVIYHCLSPEAGPADQRPRRSSFRFLWPRAIQDKVVENWARYGYIES